MGDDGALAAGHALKFGTAGWLERSNLVGLPALPRATVFASLTLRTGASKVGHTGMGMSGQGRSLVASQPLIKVDQQSPIPPLRKGLLGHFRA